jgi:hypothetical protein
MDVIKKHLLSSQRRNHQHGRGAATMVYAPINLIMIDRCRFSRKIQLTVNLRLRKGRLKAIARMLSIFMAVRSALVDYWMLGLSSRAFGRNSPATPAAGILPEVLSPRPLKYNHQPCLASNTTSHIHHQFRLLQTWDISMEPKSRSTITRNHVG